MLTSSSRSPRPRPSWSLALLVVLLAACSGDDTSTEGSPTTETSDSTGDSATTTAGTDTDTDTDDSTTSSTTGSSLQTCFDEEYCFTPPEGIACADCADDAACAALLDEQESIAWAEQQNQCQVQCSFYQAGEIQEVDGECCVNYRSKCDPDFETGG